MKINDLLPEIRFIPSFGRELSSLGDWFEKEKTKPVPGLKDFGYSIWQLNSNEPQILIKDLKEKKLASRLVVTPATWFPIKGALQVRFIDTLSQYRGKGFGQFLYKVVINDLKRVLIAGDEQTPESQYGWTKLYSDPEVNVKGYALVDLSDLALEYDDDNVLDDMFKLGADLIGPNLHNKEEYVLQFDVKNEGKRLVSYIKTRLSKIYSNAEEHYSVGLFAARNS